MKRLYLFWLSIFILSVTVWAVPPQASLSADRSDPALGPPVPPRIQIPIRWCIMDGAPSENNPGLVGESSPKQVLWRRHERVSDRIYKPGAEITFRSGATASLPMFPVLTDMNISPGSQPGDVMDDLYDGGAEFEAVINQCRMAWFASAPAVTGITAVHIRRFVDDTGSPTLLGGLGGLPFISNSASQMMSGRVMVIDNAYLLPGSPLLEFGPDSVDKLLGHELGHTLTLPHGDGLDNDSNGIIDDEGDTLDGPNLMQYNFFPPSGIDITIGQADQMRTQAILHIPDIVSCVPSPTCTRRGGVRSFGNVAVDALGDTNEFTPFADISEFGAAVDPEIGTTYFLMHFAGLIPEDTVDMGVHFLVNSDNSTNTGGDPAQQFNNLPSTPGVEVIANVVYDAGSTNVALFNYDENLQTFVQIIDPNILANLVGERLYHDTFNEAQDYEFIVSHTFQVLFPTNLLPPLQMQFGMRPVVTLFGSTLADEAQMTELTFEIEDFPSCFTTPPEASPGEMVDIVSEGLPPNESVHGLLGAIEVAQGVTDQQGNITMSFEVPSGIEYGSRLITVGLDDPDNAITADCGLFVPYLIYLPFIRR